MTFGEKLQELRKARGWSQEELAGQIHVSRQALSKWESGGAVPDTENIIALSRLFGVTTDYLLLDEVRDTGQDVVCRHAVQRRQRRQRGNVRQPRAGLPFADSFVGHP